MLKKILIVIFTFYFAQSCIEPFDAEIIDFESILVVESLITNEMKQHEVSLSRTFRFEESAFIGEKGATVRIFDDTGNTYSFFESNDGIYISDIPFALVANKSYSLSITTVDGKNYSSEKEKLPAITEINELTAERIVNDSGEDGIAIVVDSFDPTRSSNFYRYSFEETYKIIAPNWNAQNLVGDPNGGCGVITELKETENRVCYASNESNSIILASTTDLDEDRIDNFQVYFLNRNNYIISHRYSTIVKQYVQSNEAFLFYERLKEFSDSESVFSETQPGFLEGNIKSEDSDTEKVIGYFEVASVSSKRLFFNYEDFYPDDELPPYVIPCNVSAPPIFSLGGSCILRPIIENGNALLYQENGAPSDALPGPYLTVAPICGDCTLLGSTDIPEFWIE